MADRRTVLVTGATGQQGGAVARELLTKVGYDVDVPALTREYGIRPKTLRDWAGKVVW